jgi:hypothetical protein
MLINRVPSLSDFKCMSITVLLKRDEVVRATVSAVFNMLVRATVALFSMLVGATHGKWRVFKNLSRPTNHRLVREPWQRNFIISWIIEVGPAYTMEHIILYFSTELLGLAGGIGDISGPDNNFKVYTQQIKLTQRAAVIGRTFGPTLLWPICTLFPPPRDYVIGFLHLMY